MLLLNNLNLFLLLILTLRIFLWHNNNYKTIEMIILTSLFSILCSIQYLLLNAPDVAITEVSIGSCILTVFTVKSLSYLPKHKIYIEQSNNIFVYCGLCVVFLALLYQISLYPIGLNNPILYNESINYYISETEEFFRFPNIVTAILASFRGYDTFIETLVILTAGISVFTILPRKEIIETINKSIIFDKSIIKHTMIMIIPFIITYAFYIQAHGEESPGGGFQSGSIFACAIIAYSLIISEANITKYLTNTLLLRLGCCGGLIYLIAGLIPLLKHKNFLNHSYILCDIGSNNECLALSQKTGIFLIELGVGLTVFAIITSIFFNLKIKI